MGLLFGRGTRPREQRALWGISGAGDLIAPRPTQAPGVPYVSPDTAMRHSAVWACLRLRADMVSALPVGVFRDLPDGTQLSLPIPPVLLNPGGNEPQYPGNGYGEWMYSSQVDLDRSGNAIGIITARDGFNIPARVELQPLASVTLKVSGSTGKVKQYKIGNTLYNPDQIWHERQYTVPGLPMGLSPVAYAALEIGEYLSIQQFAQNWFGGGGVPRSRLTNKTKTMNQIDTAVVKEMWRASITANEPVVLGSDWEYDMIQADTAGQDWLDAKKYSITDIARFFGVPADLIDAGETGATGKVTYQNITQRDLQFLVMEMNGPITRRENALTALTPQPRYVCIDEQAILRLDPISLSQVIATEIEHRYLTPDEARAMKNRPPLTQAQIDEFLTFWPPKGAGGAASPDGGSGAGGQQGNELPAAAAASLPVVGEILRLRELVSIERGSSQ